MTRRRRPIALSSLAVRNPTFFFPCLLPCALACGLSGAIDDGGVTDSTVDSPMDAKTDAPTRGDSGADVGALDAGFAGFDAELQTPCGVDSNCQKFSSYCMGTVLRGCKCYGVPRWGWTPSCDGWYVLCFVDPCDGKQVICDAGACFTY